MVKKFIQRYLAKCSTRIFAYRPSHTKVCVRVFDVSSLFNKLLMFVSTCSVGKCMFTMRYPVKTSTVRGIWASPRVLIFQIFLRYNKTNIYWLVGHNCRLVHEFVNNYFPRACGSREIIINKLVH